MARWLRQAAPPGSRKETIMKQGPISAGAGSRRPFTLHSSPFTLLILVTSLTLGCASHGGDAGVSVITGDADYSSSDNFDVKIVQAASPMSFPKADKGSIDVNFEITIKNRLTEPVTIDRISLQSIGGPGYLPATPARPEKQRIAPARPEAIKN